MRQSVVDRAPVEAVRAQAPAVIKLPDGVDMVSAGPLFCGGITVFNPLVQFDEKFF